MSLQRLALIVALLVFAVAALLLVVCVRAARRRRWTALVSAAPAMCLLGIVVLLLPYIFGSAPADPRPFFTAPAPISASARLNFLTGALLGARRDAAQDQFFTVQAQTGKILWQRAVPYAGGEVTDGGDTIYIYTERLGGFPSTTQVAALDAATGALRWQSTWQGRAALTPLRLVDGILFFVAIADDTSSQTGRRSLYLDALAASDGRQAQDIYLGEFNHVTPQFVVAGGVAVVQVDQRVLQAWRISDGRQLWSTELDQNLNELIAAGDTLFVTSFPDELTALDARSGAIRWRKAFGNQVESPALSPDTRSGHGTLYVVTAGAPTANGAAGGASPYVVNALDPATAAVRWTFAATDHSFGASLLAGPNAVNVHSGAAFYALRTQDGALLWRRDMHDVGDHHWILSTFSHVEGSVLFVGAIEIVPNRTLKLSQPLHGQLYIFAVDQARGSLYWGAALGPVATITSSYLP